MLKLQISRKIIDWGHLITGKDDKWLSRAFIIMKIPPMILKSFRYYIKNISSKFCNIFMSFLICVDHPLKDQFAKCRVFPFNLKNEIFYEQYICWLWKIHTCKKWQKKLFGHSRLHSNHRKQLTLKLLPNRKSVIPITYLVFVVISRKLFENFEYSFILTWIKSEAY